MKVNNILWGIVFIFVGVVLGLNELNITNINLLFDLPSQTRKEPMGRYFFLHNIIRITHAYRPNR